MRKKDFTPWLLLPSIVLTLSGVTLLAPRQTASAAAPVPPAKPAAQDLREAPKTLTYDDGDGDELLEHWGDPQYSQEERRQMAGIAGGFLILGGLGLRRRPRRQNPCEVVRMPSEADFLKLDSRKAA